jgi:hypothetical protein
MVNKTLSQGKLWFFASLKHKKNQIKIKKTSGKDDQDERVVSSPKHDGDGKNTRRKMQNLTILL